MKTVSYLFLLLITKISTAITCNEDTLCESQFDICLNDTCEHKSFISPLTIEYIGLLLVLIGYAYSAMGGLAGGGIMIPIAI